MGTRILLVDDDVPLQRTMKRALEAAGYEVVQAFDGLDALHLAEKETFDLIVLDINMPGMDGRDVLRRLTLGSDTSHVPVLVHSSRSGQLDRHVVLKLGAVDFIDKPMDARLMAGKIRHLIDAAQARTSAERKPTMG